MDADFRRGEWEGLPAGERAARCRMIARGAAMLAQTQYDQAVRELYEFIAARWASLANEIERGEISGQDRSAA